MEVKLTLPHLLYLFRWWESSEE